MKRVSDHNKTWNLPVLASRGSGTSSTTTKCVEQENAVQKKEPLQTQPRDAFPEYFYKPQAERGVLTSSFVCAVCSNSIPPVDESTARSFARSVSGQIHPVQARFASHTRSVAC